MRDLIFVAYMLVLLLMAFKRPFIFTLIYAYIDIVAPQRLSYFMLNSIPLSLLVFAAAFLGYIIADDKKDSRFSVRQGAMVILLIYCGYTSFQGALPEDAMEKWDWVWKALVFAIFLPLTLRTKLRIEALALFMVLSAATNRDRRAELDNLAVLFAANVNGWQAAGETDGGAPGSPRGPRLRAAASGDRRAAPT